MKFANEKIVKNFILILSTLIISIFCNMLVNAEEITPSQTTVVETTTVELETTTAVETTTISETTTAIINDGKFSISDTALELEKGTQKQLELYNLPKEDAKVTWSTSNKFAVKVSETGLITAKNYGIATITAKCKKKTVTCIVTVRDTSRSVVLAEKSQTIYEGETVQLQVTSQNPVTYVSSNDAIAVVNETGLVTGFNPGTTTIIAKSATGYDTFTIKVKMLEVEPKAAGKIANPKYKRIRRSTKKGKVFYDRIVWTTNKTIYLKLDGIDESKVKKCKWTVEDETFLTKPKKMGSKVFVSAQTLNLTGRVKVTATVTLKNKKVKVYNSYVYITSPVVNTQELVVLGSGAGKNRQQYITFQGLSNFSKIEWTVPEDGTIKVSQHSNKLKIKGLKEGTGVIKAKVDGKKYKIRYTVYPVVKGKVKPVFAVGKTKKIKLRGIDGITPIFTSRNESVATVSATGEVTGVGSGVTYIDAKVGNINFTYRVEIAATGMPSIIKRGRFIINNWEYSQANRLQDGYYDCSALVWKSYKNYNDYHLKIGGEDYAYSAGDLFDYLNEKNQIIYFGYINMDDLKPGDIIFYGDYEYAVKYSTPGRTLDIYHASLYAGNGERIELTDAHIEGNSLKHIVGIGRVVD